MQENPPSCFTNSAPKVEQYYLYLQSITCLARVNIKYNSSHGFAVFIHLATQPTLFDILGGIISLTDKV
jgi:hypothetical protein